jgi:hypothetical protein
MVKMGFDRLVSASKAALRHHVKAGVAEPPAAGGTAWMNEY